MDLRDWHLRAATSPTAPASPVQRSARSFNGAQISRLTFSMGATSASLNADLDRDLTVLRARARKLCVNNEFAARFASLVGVNIVGAKGPQLQVRAEMASAPGTLDKVANDAIEIHFARWARQCDVGGRMGLAHLLRLIAQAIARDGESLVVPIRDRNVPYGLKLQVLEADRLDETLNARLDNGNIIRQGVELDTALKPIAYHLKTSHPGDNFTQGTAKRVRVPAGNIWHLFLPQRAEQVRGYTWLAPAVMRMGQLQGFEESAVIAARIGASKIAALEQSDDSIPDDMDSQADAKVDGNLHFSAEPGEVFQLPPGYKLNSWDPQYPHENFEAFVQQCLRAVSMGLGVATHNLSGNMSDVNYSSARIAEMSEREIWIMLQDWFIDALVMPLFEEWLRMALLLGQITFPQTGKALPSDKFEKFLLASHFQGRRWAWVDPEKEAKAAEILIRLGLTSRTRITASQGMDFDDIVAELAQEKTRMTEAGIKPEAPPAPAQPSTSKDDPDDTDLANTPGG